MKTNQMTSTRSLALIGLLISVAGLVLGCQPARNAKQKVRTLRQQDANTVTPTGGKSWGEVTSTLNDAAFRQEVVLMTQAFFTGSNDQLGNVSPASAQATGVAFWGNADLKDSTTTYDPSTLALNIAIYDDKAGQSGTVWIPIAAGESDFRLAQGTKAASQITLSFESDKVTVSMVGTVSNNFFTGTMTYKSSATSGQFRTLGAFRVPSCGFFVCK